LGKSEGMDVGSRAGGGLRVEAWGFAGAEEWSKSVVHTVCSEGVGREV